MAPRTAKERLTDIREAASDLRDFVGDMETDAFHALPHADRIRYRAVKNTVTELGEAIKTLPKDVRERNPDVDWKGFAGLRDMAAHQYFNIDTRRLLPIIKCEVQKLIAVVDAELRLLEEDKN